MSDPHQQKIERIKQAIQTPSKVDKHWEFVASLSTVSKPVAEIALEVGMASSTVMRNIRRFCERNNLTIICERHGYHWHARVPADLWDEHRDRCEAYWEKSHGE